MQFFSNLDIHVIRDSSESTLNDYKHRFWFLISAQYPLWKLKNRPVTKRIACPNSDAQSYSALPGKMTMLTLAIGERFM